MANFITPKSWRPKKKGVQNPLNTLTVYLLFVLFNQTKLWKSRRHRRCIEQRSLFAKFVSHIYTKRLLQNSYLESVCYTSVALCAVGTSVTLRYLRSLRDSVCLLYKTFSLSLHISEEPLFYRHECQLCWKKPTQSHIHSYYSLAPTPLLFYCCTWYLPVQQAYQSISR